MEKTPISILQELMTKLRVAPPIYETYYSGPDHNRLFHCTVNANGTSISAKGTTKKESKHNAARNMLATIGDCVETTAGEPLCKIEPSKQFINYVGLLNEFASINHYVNPVYQENICIQIGSFETVCCFQNLKIKGCGFNKKDAKQESAKCMILKLKELGIYDNKLDTRSNNKSSPNREYIKQEYDDSIQCAIEKYTKLVNKGYITKTEIPIHYSTTSDSESVQYVTWEYIDNYFKLRGYEYNLSVYQEKPLLILLKIEKAVLFATGNSVNEIKQNLAQRIIKMIEVGTNFTTFETS